MVIVNTRITLTFLRSILGILLLSDVSFLPTYHNIHQFHVLQAGLSEMNSTLLDIPGFNETAPELFWWYFPSILADGQFGSTVEPISCSGTSCTSYFLPGSLSTIIFDPTLPNITGSDYPSATSYMQNNAPGYQLDFSPMDEAPDPPMTLDDCHVYGLTQIAVQVCLKKSNSSLLAGKYIYK